MDSNAKEPPDERQAEKLPDGGDGPGDGEQAARAELDESVDLVRRAQAGDQEALNRLFARYQDRLHRIARILMGAKLRQAMESMDLVQEAHAVALRKIASFELREHAGIIHWLQKILENQMRDARKGVVAQKRDPSRNVALEAMAAHDASSMAYQLAGDGPTPSQDASRLELERLYDACVEELEPEHRDVILLRDYEGGSWEYVCERMGRPSVHATQELHRRARIKLARLFGRRCGPGVGDDISPWP